MDEVADISRLTFNGPLEAGVRAVAILTAAYPRTFDIQRMTALDFLLIRTSELGGPSDLHPPVPIKTPATDVRRGIVQTALLLMMTRDLVSREVRPTGIRYKAGETADLFLSAMHNHYHSELKLRAEWLAVFVQEYEDDEIDLLMTELFDNWVAEFQVAERGLGAEE